MFLSRFDVVICLIGVVHLSLETSAMTGVFRKKHTPKRRILKNLQCPPPMPAGEDTGSGEANGTGTPPGPGGANETGTSPSSGGVNGTGTPPRPGGANETGTPPGPGGANQTGIDGNSTSGSAADLRTIADETRNHTFSVYPIQAYFRKADGLTIADYQVKVGEHDDKVNEGTEQIFDVVSFVLHEQYNPDTVENDIAVIRIKPRTGAATQYMDLSPNGPATKACLPAVDTPYAGGTMCQVAGWGALNDGMNGTVEQKYPNILQTTQVPILDPAVCKETFGDRIAPTSFCAGVMAGGTDTCQGDSGGPFMCPLNGETGVFGVVSWGDGCAQKDSPGVYVKVTDFLPWIKQKVEESYD